MLHIEHFGNGWMTPVLAFVLSFIGSVLGLRCAVHAKVSAAPLWWLIAASVALGGAAIWVMHFTAMLGFGIGGVPIHYDVPLTLLSAVVAIGVVLIGLTIVTGGGNEWVTLPFGGAITGLGVAAMHYLGMWAMRVQAVIEYEPTLMVLSLVVAVVTATAALWFMLHVRGLLMTMGAALVMGIAVCGMHYTAMAAMRVRHSESMVMVDGVTPVQLLLPLIATVSLVVTGLVIVVGLAESEFDEKRRPRQPK
ncbi:MHYT domain-containing protein [Nocardia alba]|uniref:NO-binding membrane sensor protein with MHYT domain n=1 Tax=Nocardia alba TaxID=225051 RepID=A0A4R1G052_9NOCA|nr:MHYT domain-containing protein [Nocardia alba]TCJ99920.1 NO-binding membrane sensor protein with MHYT domain [Nocardia alba]